MILGVPRETSPGERRVALVPSAIPTLVKQGVEVVVEAGAGVEAGFSDADYTQRGATVFATRAEVFERADALAQVRAFGANLATGADDLPRYRKGQSVIATCDPLSALDADRQAADAGVALLSLELMPRITRAQSMDVLSSQATIAGYKAVLMAADHLPRMFPMMMTAAGTIAAAHAFVIGAGVAGLQAIATARRLGAIVHAYDVRPAVKEQVQSLGAKFVEMELETGAAEDAGGYARALGEDFYRKQRELMAKVVAENDVVVSTAAIPGKRSPLLITKAAVEGMRPGSVIVDLAAERGGNCELTRAGETVVHGGVTILGPLDLPSTVPYHASQMFAKNVATFLLHLVKNGALVLDSKDEITAGTLVTLDGEVVHPRVRELADAGPKA